MPRPKRQRPKPHPLYPEPGAWVLGNMHGLPEICPPGSLPLRLSIDDVRTQVTYEGLGFCIYEYISPERITDKTLREAWRVAKAAMNEVCRLLDEERPPVVNALKTHIIKRGL